jgi:hypothetical protein
MGTKEVNCTFLTGNYKDVIDHAPATTPCTNNPTDFRKYKKNITLLNQRVYSTHTAWLWDPPSLLYKGYRGLFPLEQSSQGVKLTTRLPTSAEVKKTQICISTPLICLHGIMLD